MQNVGYVITLTSTITFLEMLDQSSCSMFVNVIVVGCGDNPIPDPRDNPILTLISRPIKTGCETGRDVWIEQKSKAIRTRSL